MAVGSLAAEAALQNPGKIRVVNGYEHSRTIISDFTAAEKVLQSALRSVSGRKLFQPAPILIMHPLQQIEGGLTGIEARALLELAAGAGARRVCVGGAGTGGFRIDE